MFSSTQFQRHPDTDLIVNFLREKTTDDFIPYIALDKLTGSDISGAKRHRLLAARKTLRRDYHMEFSCDEQDGARGVRLCAPEEVVNATASQLRRSRNAARRGIAVSTCAIGEISQEARSRLVVNQTVLGLVAQVTKPSNVKKVSAIANGASGTSSEGG